MSLAIGSDQQYNEWLTALKNKVRTAQLKAILKVNTTLLTLYWELGADMVTKQTNTQWGDGFIAQVSKDLMTEFPELKGFSRSNLMYIKKWYMFYSQPNVIVQQLVGQLATEEEKPHVLPDSAAEQLTQMIFAQITQIPWGHNIVIISKCKQIDEALFYVQHTIAHNWSRNVLVHQIESNLYQRKGKAINNFALTLPKPQSDLAIQTLKDPYIFDFLHMTDDYDERDLENALVNQVTQFLLELGAGFAYLGKQVLIQVGERDFYIDLLFYHARLHCYIVVELKTVEFEPEHAGKLNFYLKAVDSQLRSEQDQPTIGILICKKKDQMVAEYALSDIHKPIGISEYQLTQSLPDELRSSLPSIEEIERELRNLDD